jgi:aminopeptidase C
LKLVIRTLTGRLILIKEKASKRRSGNAFLTLLTKCNLEKSVKRCFFQNKVLQKASKKRSGNAFLMLLTKCNLSKASKKRSGNDFLTLLTKCNLEKSLKKQLNIKNLCFSVNYLKFYFIKLL